MRPTVPSLFLATPALIVAVAACSSRTVTPPTPGPVRDGGARLDATTSTPTPDAGPGPRDGGTPPPDDGGATPVDGGGEPSTVMGVDLLSRLAGLWSGPALDTPLGNLPRMVMDFRPVDDRTLFGRVDLDANNALRMAFAVETHGGRDVVVFRNGGLFMGLSRDTRTELVEVNAGANTWRFCAIQGGCGYNEALFTLDSPAQLTLLVTVRGRTHLRWNAARQETRTVPTPFPAAGSTGPGDTPFPPMPTVAATVRWSTALAADADVWLILSTQDCSLGGCIVSRHHLASARAGDTSASLTLDQLHAGTYKVQAFLDRDRNVGTTFAPDSGDGVAAPNQALTVAPTGTTTLMSTIVFDLP